jgi:hypothetical protein
MNSSFSEKLSHTFNMSSIALALSVYELSCV